MLRCGYLFRRTLEYAYIPPLALLFTPKKIDGGMITGETFLGTDFFGGET